MFLRTPEGLIQESCDENWDHYKHMSHSSTEDGIANQLACYGVPTTLEDYCMQVCMRTAFFSPLQACNLTGCNLKLNPGANGELRTISSTGRGFFLQDVVQAHGISLVEVSEPCPFSSGSALRLLLAADRCVVRFQKGASSHLSVALSSMLGLAVSCG